MNTKSNRTGFTLIELLVVVAIISLLVSIIIASLEVSRGKASNTAIKSNLSTIQTQSALLFSSTGSFTGVCSDSKTIAALASAKSAAGVTGGTATLGTAGTANTAVCHEEATGNSYAVSIPLKSPKTDSWCVDSVSKKMQFTGYMSSGASLCP